MFFTVGVFTGDGNFDIKKFFQHTEAFNLAITLETPGVIPYIMEKQWSVSESKMIYRTYFIKSGGVFKPENAFEPIYSNQAELKYIQEYRDTLTASIDILKQVYEYYKIPNPYLIDNLYYLTRSEMVYLYEKLTNDKILLKYRSCITDHLNDIEQSISFTELKISWVKKKIANLSPAKVIPFLEDYRRRLKATFVSNFHGGGSCIDLFITNSLIPYN
jgi:hypothetical protein